MDDHGRSAVGEFLRSAIGDYRKAVAPTQERIGNELFQSYIIGPVDTGTALAFAIQTNANLTGSPDIEVVGMMLVAYDFSEVIALHVIEGAVLEDGITQLEMVGDSVRMTSTDEVSEIGFTLDVPSAGDASIISSDRGVISALYEHGGGWTAVFLFTSSGPGVGAFDSAGVYSDMYVFYKTSLADMVASRVPFYDGASVFMGFSRSTSRGIIKIDASDPANAEAVTFSAAGTLGAVTLVGGSSSIVAGLIARGTNSPILFGLNTDLTVAWAKSTKKQESTVTIVVNDTGSTYRITIGGTQFAQVTGDAGGAAATATALKNACAASVQSQFTARTFTVSGDTVTVQANFPGILYTFSSTVTGGTGTVSTTNNRHAMPATLVPTTAQLADPEGHLAIPCGPYGVFVIDIDDGALISAAIVENPATVQFLSKGATIIDGVTYLSAQTEFPESFGSSGDQDWQIFRFDEPPDNRTVLFEDVALTVTSYSTVTEEPEPAGFDLDVVTNPVASPLDTFETLETEYVY